MDKSHFTSFKATIGELCPALQGLLCSPEWSSPSLIFSSNEIIGLGWIEGVGTPLDVLFKWN
jgi:hypothetical protein